MSSGNPVASQLTVEAVANALNENLDLPFIPESGEQYYCEWIAGKVVPLIPDWVSQFIVSAADGLTEQEVKQHEDVLTNELNKIIDLPWAPEFVEEQLIRPVVKLILGYALKGSAIPAN